MIKTELDHLVIATRDLQQGSEWMEDLLGVSLEPGGEHKTQGTHNRLLRLGEDKYLEVIAIDPQGITPGSPRWFDLDDPELQSKIADTPRLITWAARVSDIEALAQISPYDQFPVQNLSRGDLRWRVAFPVDGHMPEEGILPLTIEWQVEMTPPKRLSRAGCDFIAMDIQHHDAHTIQEKLSAMKLNELNDQIKVIQHPTNQIQVRLQTPRGEVELKS